LLNSPTDALLIADEVGLGKTIEAGLIWTELRARLESNKLAVLCPKTLCDKWRVELDKRFGVDAKIVGASDFFDALEGARSRNKGFAVIASMQGLRPPKSWNDDTIADEESGESFRKKLARFLESSADDQPLIDLLVIDEAHHMRNPETQLYQLAQLVSAVSSHRVFLSATPIHLKNRDLNSLLQLIDSDTFEFENTLNELININEPIVKARDLLQNPKAKTKEIIACLNDAHNFGFIKNSQSLRLIRDDLTAAPLDNYRRANLASRLENVNQLANYITRTRRRDVEEFRVKRDPKAPHFKMNEHEQIFYEAISNEVRKYALNNNINERFLLSTPQRLLTSSPAAASAYWSSFGPQEVDPIEDSDDDLDNDRDSIQPLVSRLSDASKRLRLSDILSKNDTKFSELLKQLRQFWEENNDDKVIIFSSFKPTLNYLSQRLKNENIPSLILHGSVSESREKILSRFKSDGALRVLLSSEVGSEGVDLQFCWVVVNYDLPWNPMRLEQRIGRVDRLGQTKKKVIILNLVYDGTIDDRIYHRLYKRLGIGERALGEFEAVLGEPIREMTAKLLDPNLTDKQKDDAIDQAAQAAANLKVHEEKLESEAGSLVRHGDYILQKILESKALNRWLHAEDILTYVKDRLYRSFSGCQIETNPPGADTYRISLDADAQNMFVDFIIKRSLRGSSRLTGSDEKLRFRFTPSVIKSPDPNIENISQVHPLVQFAASLDASDSTVNHSEAIAASINPRDLRTPCPSGAYLISVRKWLSGTASDRASNTSMLAFEGISLDSGELIDPESAESLTISIAENGRAIPNIKSNPRLSKALSLANEFLFPSLDKRFHDYLSRITAELSDRSDIQRRALLNHLKSSSDRINITKNKFLHQIALLEQRGDAHKAQKLRSLAANQDNKLSKLKSACDLRLKEIDSYGTTFPQESEITLIFAEVL
ncbi:MAG: DEAD/DEAH box helicase, partial [Alphaproteobacteria bacterium]|nr:DEAD/DEAH box helicase [Alphaproteobacteria bacterium]